MSILCLTIQINIFILSNQPLYFGNCPLSVLWFLCFPLLDSKWNSIIVLCTLAKDYHLPCAGFTSTFQSNGTSAPSASVPHNY